ncbi:hypothetical protein QBC44DRAFT_311537 [Cladorrhinum sp. PSN332]|nr:hypothetical protein QBC44DRAFT_311537 [Cladorrhinum sp. PSN332]
MEHIASTNPNKTPEMEPTASTSQPEDANQASKVDPIAEALEREPSSLVAPQSIGSSTKIESDSAMPLDPMRGMESIPLDDSKGEKRIADINEYKHVQEDNELDVDEHIYRGLPKAGVDHDSEYVEDFTLKDRVLASAVEGAHRFGRNARSKLNKIKNVLLSDYAPIDDGWEMIGKEEAQPSASAIDVSRGAFINANTTFSRPNKSLAHQRLISDNYGRELPQDNRTARANEPKTPTNPRPAVPNQPKTARKFTTPYTPSLQYGSAGSPNPRVVKTNFSSDSNQEEKKPEVPPRHQPRIIRPSSHQLQSEEMASTHAHPAPRVETATYDNPLNVMAAHAQMGPYSHPTDNANMHSRRDMENPLAWVRQRAAHIQLYQLEQTSRPTAAVRGLAPLADELAESADQ